MARNMIEQYVFTPGVAGAGIIRIPGRYRLDQITLITNATRNTVIYNFADPTFTGTTAVFTAGDFGTTFPAISQRVDGYTTITLAVSTATQNSGDRLQIFMDEESLTTRPFAFGTDAIERIRVSTPESLIDADFEYGLQPTKWAGYGMTRFYGGLYDTPGIDLTVNTITTDGASPNSLITVTFASAHNLTANTTGVNISGLNQAITGFSRADGAFIVESTPLTTQITYRALGVVGTVGQSLFTSATIARRARLYSAAAIPATITSDGAIPSVITITTTSQHGFVPGMLVHTIVSGGTSPDLATGPFIVTSVTGTTTFRFTARGQVITPTSVTLYVLTPSKQIHRPFDGGVLLASRSPAHGAVTVRQSKKYFRYQSGKGVLWSSGTLFAPNYDLATITATGTAAGSTITVTTDAIDHSLQIGATVRIEGVTTTGYNGTYTVTGITNDYAFTVTAATTLGATTAVLGTDCRVFVTVWHGGVVRSGMFDDQNGLFWEYDGSTLYAVRRNSTFQLTGVCAVTLNSQTISGTGTRFLTQVKAGDKIVIKGMTHRVAAVQSDTVMYVTQDYRGPTGSGVRISIVRETRIPQSQFNIDTLNGSGPSGFTFNAGKMQMVGIQFSWYGAGFVDFMMRGSDGNWVFAHRIKNNNVNNEAYMRTGNLPVRYSVENDPPNAALTASLSSGTTASMSVSNVEYFPSTGTVQIGTELIRYTSKTGTIGAGTLNTLTRGTTMSQYIAGNTYSLAGTAAGNYNAGEGVVLVSNTCSPTLSHWGSALIMDGNFDEDRGYIFNYQRQVTVTPTTTTAFLIRLAPSVSNSQVGALGVRELLNRSQLLLKAIGVAISQGSGTLGACVVEGVINPRNFSTATWVDLAPEANGGQPSFAQVATTFSWTTGTSAIPGEQIFAFSAPTVAAGAVNDRLDLNELKELTGAPIGGDFMYPDGSDILAINVRITAGTSAVAQVLLRWSEAQA